MCNYNEVEIYLLDGSCMEDVLYKKIMVWFLIVNSRGTPNGRKEICATLN